MSGQTQITSKSLPLQVIDGSDRTFSVTLGARGSDQQMEDWITSVGILVPLRVNPKSNGTFRIVSGFRRFRAARHLGLKNVPCLLDPSSPATLLLKAVVENLSTRGLEELEKAMIVFRMNTEFETSKEELIERILPLLGVQSSRRRLDYYLELGQLPELLLQAVNGGVLIPEVALKLRSWNSCEVTLFVRLLAEYRLGRNKQRKLFEIADDLKAICSGDFVSLWEQSGAASIDADQRLPSEVRYTRIQEALARLRYPTLSKHQQRFQLLKGALGLSAAVRLAVPEYFEGDSIEVSFSSRNPKEFVQATEQLSKAATCQELKEIFDLL